MTLKAVVYTDAGVDTYEDVVAAKDAHGTTWVRATDPTEEELATLRSAYDLHRLQVEDVENNVRPKVELFDQHTFVLTRVARLRAGETTFDEELEERPVGIFLGSDWLVTVTLEELSAVQHVWRAVFREENRLLQRGADFTAYRLVDRIVDDYFLILEDIEGDIELVEEGITDEPDPETLEMLNSIRRELLSVRGVIWPMRDVASVLARGEPDQIAEETDRYYRDVYDHLVQLVDLTETYRDLVRGSRDIYLNVLSQSTNEVMKRLTVVATILLPLTFVVGVYGMNFGDSAYNMPELHWRFAYPAVMVGMTAVSLVLVAYFYREGWF